MKVTRTGPRLDIVLDEMTGKIHQQLKSRSYRVANELRNSAQEVLRVSRLLGHGSGQRVFMRIFNLGKKQSWTEGILESFHHRLRKAGGPSQGIAE